MMLKTFLNTIIENNKMPIDVYEGATWMSITALSEQSVSQGGIQLVSLTLLEENGCIAKLWM